MRLQRLFSLPSGGGGADTGRVTKIPFARRLALVLVVGGAAGATMLVVRALHKNGSLDNAVRGNGVAREDRRTVAAFVGVEARQGLHVEVAVEAGATPTVLVQGDENVLPHLTTIVEDGTLVVGVERNLSLAPSVPLVVHVRMPAASHL